MTSREIAYAAYRLGVIETILHPDVQAALPGPGVFIEALRNEKEARLSALREADVELVVGRIEPHEGVPS